jgi:hypothetical protein
LNLAGIRRSHLLATIVGAVLATAIVGGATIVSAHGGDNSPANVHACVGKFTGNVRIVGVDGKCLPHIETPMHWMGALGFYKSA